MKIARRDSDLLVLEATRADDGRAKQWIALAGCLAPAGIGVFAASHGAWWPQLETANQLVIGFSFFVGLLVASFAVTNWFPYVACLALDRSSRKVLLVWKTLRRTRSEEFDFEQVLQVGIEMVMGSRQRLWWSLRLKRAHGRDVALVIREFCGVSGKDEAEGLAAEMREMLGVVAVARAPAMLSPSEERVQRTTGFVVALFGIAFGAALIGHPIEMWQTPAWPRAAGIIESVRIGESGRAKFFSNKITIDYRYAVDGIEHRGTRFNVRDNLLTAQEVPFVERRYRAGEACEVSYKPGDPARSFLTIDGARFWAGFEGAAFLACLLSGVIWAVHTWRQIARGKSAAVGYAPAELFEPVATPV